ncbi:hypothetical protein HS086_01255 [Turicibacter sp. PIG517]|uniref:Spaf_1101 family AAA-like ATPase n=1 Tax=Turicibacter bilis TaxID=2735723 RepID=UPI001D775B6C|nr:hypothetical protein [Turicibacter bilis]MBS3201966.1 hypothetical protein [Turicibacter bilis]
MIDSERIIPIIYKKEQKRKKDIARFHKCIFHMHSPASFDYGLIDRENSWKNFSEIELIGMTSDRGIPFNLIPPESFDALVKDDYESRLELLAYSLVAYTLLENEIELVVLTDHNTILGYKKLVKAIKLVYNQLKAKKNLKSYTEVILGIEISCGDKCHVVGIFNHNNKEQMEDVNNFINDYIMSESDGTYLSSQNVLEIIYEIGGIGYIAHLNSSNLFKKDYFNGAYKKALFGLEYHQFFGVSDLIQGKSLCTKISEFTENKKFNYIVDEDSHSISEIGKKYFWIKGQKLDFRTIYDALHDFQTSIAFEEPTEIESYIKSLYIDNKCFYKDKKNGGGLVIPFSENMNSLIGGRGTGKSTILNIIEFLVSQIVENKKTLEYIIKQGSICLLYAYKGNDYYIMFHSGGGDENDKAFIEKCFPRNNVNSYLTEKENDRQQRKNVIQNRIQIYTYNGKVINEITEVKQLLDKMFTRKFSVNHLVNIAGDQLETIKFVLDLLNKNSNLNKGIQLSRLGSTWNWIKSKYDELEETRSNRLKEVNEVIKPFNESQRNKIRITYSQKEMTEVPFNWRDLLSIYQSDLDKPFMGYNIIHSNIIELLEDLSSKTNPINVVLKLYHSQYDYLIKGIEITKYCIVDNVNVIHNDLKKVNNENVKDLLERIKNIIINKEKFICDYFRTYLKEIDTFGLEFNINNKESTQELRTLFKPIDEISMGQKVVAMISFILEYSRFTNDLSPLIIDQPEDNLDNQYIYRNLVKDFRSIKDTRQIIVATHNSTILVNSGCENVVILESNHEQTWTDKTGYSKQKEINRRIINILEGGVEAFQHKVRIYRDNI